MTSHRSAPHVSVIIPAHNSADFIVTAVESVLAQTFADYEIVVVDDGSTDDTREVLKRFEGRIVYLHQQNRGVSAARNAGLQRARGELVCFLDADDIWRPEKLARQTAFMAAHPTLGLLFADAEESEGATVQKPSVLNTMMFGPDSLSQIPLHDAFRKLLTENFIPTSTVMMRKTCLATAGLFDENLPNAEDRDMWLRMSSQFPIGCVPEVLAIKRSHGANISTRTEIALQSRIEVWMQCRDRFPTLAPPQLYDRLLADAHQQLGYLLLAKDDRRGARRSAVTSVRSRRPQRWWCEISVRVSLVAVDRALAAVADPMADRAIHLAGEKRTAATTCRRNRPGQGVTVSTRGGAGSDVPVLRFSHDAPVELHEVATANSHLDVSVGDRIRPVKRVVMIAYFFPPDGNAAVYRPLRFVRQLSASQWAPTVVTVDGSSHERFDPQLLKTLPDNVGIRRVAGRDLWQAIQAWRARRLQAQITGGAAEHVAKVYQSQQRPLRRWARNVVRTIEASVYYPDHARFWIRAATAATVAVCHQTRPDVIVATGGPWSSFLVAHAASRRTGVPYVLDFRDSWTLTCNDDFELRRPRWAARQDRQVLSRLFRDAQAVIFRYDTEAECYWRAYQGTLSVDRIHIIPNGYEGALETSPPPPGDRCTVLYTGTVTPYRYDTFLDALSLLKSSHPAEARKLRVLFVGEGGRAMAEAAAERSLDDLIATMNPVPLHEVERLQREAHVLLLLGVKPYQGYELCGSKVFGYLKASRPILGVLPNDEHAESP